jgi:hypothetical protein
MFTFSQEFWLCTGQREEGRRAYVVTGTMRGIGRALAEAVIARNKQRIQKPWSRFGLFFLNDGVMIDAPGQGDRIK